MYRIINLLLVIIILASCKSYTSVATTRNNVCKTLEGKTILYAIFVDSDGTHPWSEYDLNSTIDSIKLSIDWIQNQAALKGVSLKIDFEYAIKNSSIPFKEEFKYTTLSGTLFKYTDLRKGIKLVDDWSNNIAKDVARTLPKDTASVVLTQNKSNDRERLIAKLRNKYKTDNIAVVYFINNYFENELSVTLHTASSTETEYAVVSTKSPSVIAHEFLHIFGAWDLYSSPFDRSIFQRMKKRKAMKKYPDEIMAFAYRKIDSLKISPLTEYLIGWNSKVDHEHSKIFIRRRWKLLEY